ncbi:hypothetical protein EDC01DRAFT_632572 [Geopyxis carbonaria]|nr:hypothetical protein EDC01DRAFT_632572 [Geopyxis carbonaria]
MASIRSSGDLRCTRNTAHCERKRVRPFQELLSNSKNISANTLNPHPQASCPHSSSRTSSIQPASETISTNPIPLLLRSFLDDPSHLSATNPLDTHGATAPPAPGTSETPAEPALRAHASLRRWRMTAMRCALREGLSRCMSKMVEVMNAVGKDLVEDAVTDAVTKVATDAAMDVVTDAVRADAARTDVVNVIKQTDDVNRYFQKARNNLTSRARDRADTFDLGFSKPTIQFIQISKFTDFIAEAIRNCNPQLINKLHVIRPPSSRIIQKCRRKTQDIHGATAPPAARCESEIQAEPARRASTGLRRWRMTDIGSMSSEWWKRTSRADPAPGRRQRIMRGTRYMGIQRLRRYISTIGEVVGEENVEAIVRDVVTDVVLQDVADLGYGDGSRTFAVVGDANTTCRLSRRSGNVKADNIGNYLRILRKVYNLQITRSTPKSNPNPSRATRTHQKPPLAYDRHAGRVTDAVRMSQYAEDAQEGVAVAVDAGRNVGSARRVKVKRQGSRSRSGRSDAGEVDEGEAPVEDAVVVVVGGVGHFGTGSRGFAVVDVVGKMYSGTPEFSLRNQSTVRRRGGDLDS